MLDKLEIFQMAQAMAQHAGTRQAAIAQNIAQADTPGYKARDVASFSETYRAQDGGAGQRATREKHLTGNADRYEPEIITLTNSGSQSPNGNTVSVELEMMRAAEVKIQHDTALTVYRSSLDILRTSIGRR